MTSKAKPAGPTHLTMLPDPPEEERDMQQLPHIANAVLVLRAYYRHTLGRSDVLVSGEGYLCRRAGEARRSPHPHCVVALNLPFDPDIVEQEGNGYTIEEIGQPPDFVLEVGSTTSGLQDYTVKRDIYAGLGATEYWRFDPTGGRHHDVPLAGDTLVEGTYERVPVENGPDGVHRGYSVALSLELHWQERRLRFFDPVAVEYLPALEESLAQRDQAQARVHELEEELRRMQGR